MLNIFKNCALCTLTFFLLLFILAVYATDLYLLPLLKTNVPLNAQSSVDKITISPDGNTLAAVKENGLITLVNLTTGEEQAHLLNNSQSVITSLTFSPDSKTLTTVDDSTITLWNGLSEEEASTFPTQTQGTVRSLIHSPNGKILAGIDEQAGIIIWDVISGSQKWIFPNSAASISEIAFSPGGDILASSGNDGQLKLWDMNTGQSILSITNPSATAFTHLAFNSTGTLAAIDANGIVSLWDPASGYQQLILSGPQNPVKTFAFSPNAKILASSALDAKIELWNLSGKQSQPDPIDLWNVATMLTFNPDGNILASVDTDNIIYLWNTANGELQKRLVGHLNQIAAVAFNSNDQTVASIGNEGQIFIWALNTGFDIFDGQLAQFGEIEDTTSANDNSLSNTDDADASDNLAPKVNQKKSSSVSRGLRKRTAPTPKKNWIGVISIDISTDGKTVAIAHDDGRIHIWNDAGDEIAVLAEHGGKPVMDIAFVPNGHLLISAGRDSQVRMWDTKDWKLQITLQGHDQPATSVAASPNGKYIVSSSESTKLLLWSATTGKLVDILYGPINIINTLAFGPKGKYLAAASDDGRIYIWKISNRGKFTLVHTLLGHKGTINALTYTTNGKFLFSGGEDTNIRIWNLKTGSQIKLLQGHNAAIRTLAVNPNGRELVSSGGNARILMWNLETHTLKGTLASNTNVVNILKYQMNGRLLAGDENANITEWDMEKRTRIKISAPPTEKISKPPNTNKTSIEKAVNLTHSTIPGQLTDSTTETLNVTQTATKTLSPSDPPSFAEGLSTLFMKVMNWFITTAAAAPLPDPNRGPGGPILVVTNSSTSPFGNYYAEILRNEGFNAFSVADIGDVSMEMLKSYDVVILAQMTLPASRVTDFTNWVNAGGNLIAMRPDPQLYNLLGITGTGNILREGYLLVNTSRPIGNGITAHTMQFHGMADRYNLSGADELARLYLDADSATSNPALTLHSVGSNGGQAATFSYNLAASIVYTRQGNPAWATQERDDFPPQRPNDRFYGNALKDPQPDWVDLSKVAIPQADEQQRLLANLLINMNMNKKPLPRFWYFPRGEKAVIIMTGDDHANEGTWGRFEQLDNASPPGCSVEDWECLRGTSYLFYNTEELIPGQAAAYTEKGFEVGLHINTRCANYTEAELDTFYTQQISDFTTQFPNIPRPATQRHHCIAWSGWAITPKTQINHGIRFDTNYYYYPPSWVANTPGFMTGSGMPMRFADLDGSLIDVYQSATQMNDETGQQYPFTINTLLDRALGEEGYYGAFNINAHTDQPVIHDCTEVIDCVINRHVPMVSSLQMLDWLDGRNSSSFGSIAWNANVLSFTVVQGTGANGLQVHIPMHSNAGIISSITRGGSDIPFTQENIKGIDYAVLSATDAAYNVTYSLETAPPSVVSFSPADNATGIPLTTDITATFSEAMDVSTLNTSTIELRDINNVLISAAITYLPRTYTAVLKPMSALRSSTLYTATLKSEQIKDLSGNSLATDSTFSFTTGLGAECPCSIWEDSTTPKNPNLSDPNGVELGVRFKSNLDGYITSIRFYKGIDNTGKHTGNLWTSTGQLLATAFFTNETDTGWQQVDFATPVAITADTEYIASYYAPNGHYAAENYFFADSGVTNAPLELPQDIGNSGNGVFAYGPESSFPNFSFRASNYWVDIKFTICPCSLWSDATIPSIITTSDSKAVELGVKFQSQVAGQISGLRFYKAASNTGTHIGSLWDFNGNPLAQATFTNETSSGWQTVSFSTPVTINPGEVYIASYHTEVGHYSVDKNYFKLSGFNNAPISALQDGVNGGNGLYLYGSGGFPVNSWKESNYWVDVIFTKD